MEYPPPNEEELPLDVPAPTKSRPRRVRGQRRWEEDNQRVTFYCPVDLLRRIQLEMVRSGRSKTQVAVDALEEHLRNRI